MVLNPLPRRGQHGSAEETELTPEGTATAANYSKSGTTPKGKCLGDAKECMLGAGDCCTDQHALFIALCRRYGVKPFRYNRMHRQTVMIRAPASFVRTMLWPEFEDLSHALTAHLNEITEKIIREEVHEATQDAEEIGEPRRLG